MMLYVDSQQMYNNKDSDLVHVVDSFTGLGLLFITRRGIPEIVKIEDLEEHEFATIPQEYKSVKVSDENFPILYKTLLDTNCLAIPISPRSAPRYATWLDSILEKKSRKAA